VEVTRGRGAEGEQGISKMNGGIKAFQSESSKKRMKAHYQGSSKREKGKRS